MIDYFQPIGYLAIKENYYFHIIKIKILKHFFFYYL